VREAALTNRGQEPQGSMTLEATQCDPDPRSLLGQVWRAVVILLLAAAALARPHAADADPPVLVIDNGGQQHRFTAAELLARPDSADVTVKGDIYHGGVRYRAVPLLKLFGVTTGHTFDTVETRSTDGFVGQLPLALVDRGAHGGAVAWIAAEDPAHPWPPMPTSTDTAGPFYLIWQYSERSGVTREQWPYQLVGLTLVESPVHRWPQLAVPSNLPSHSLARHGQQVFLTQCLTCHRLNGGGAADVGPDLGRPMNATRYLTDSGLRAIIRNPRAVRTWPEQHMAGFDKAVMSDADLDALVAYLHVMAGNVGAAKVR
jgi:mono/diheme cytochrome c family protein